MMTRCVSKHVGAIKWTKRFSVLKIYIQVHKLVYENNWTTYSVVSIVITSATNLKHNGMYNLEVQP
jgi:hypothetical protein